MVSHSDDPLSSLFQTNPVVAQNLAISLQSTCQLFQNIKLDELDGVERVLRETFERAISDGAEIPMVTPTVVVMPAGDGGQPIAALMLVWHSSAHWEHVGDCDVFLGSLSSNNPGGRRTDLYYCMAHTVVHVRWGSSDQHVMSVPYGEIEQLPTNALSTLHFLAAKRVLQLRPEICQLKPRLMQ